MKTMIFTLAMSLALAAASGQQKQGRVLYERTVQLQMHVQGMVLANDEREHMLPHSRKDKLEVLFGDNQSLRRTVAEEEPKS